MRAALAGLVCILLLLAVASSCNQVGKWRDSQIRDSHDIARGDLIEPPAQEIKPAGELADDLPVDASWTVLEYSEAEGVHVKLLSSWDTGKTSEWLLGRLAELGYGTGDNPSALLGGAIYSKPDGEYKSIYVKIDMNTHEQCTVDLRATE